VKGIILLAPVSDYADMVKRVPRARLKKVTAHARSLVRRGKGHELLPNSAVTMPWGPLVCDAQRFLSLYTPDSKETVFCYEQPGKAPRALRSVNMPMLTLWAGKDEYADRPAKDVAQWFAEHTRSRGSRVVVVPQATHGFKRKEKWLVRTIRNWIQDIS
jgi:pimeloyl-ACP methyl ester carboxylesterase